MRLIKMFNEREFNIRYNSCRTPACRRALEKEREEKLQEEFMANFWVLLMILGSIIIIIVALKG